MLLSPVWSQPAFPLDFDIASLDNAIATLELMRPVLPANLLGTRPRWYQPGWPMACPSASR